MFERKAKPEASYAAAAISGKEAEPWRVGIGCGFQLQALQHSSLHLRRLDQTLLTRTLRI